MHLELSLMFRSERVTKPRTRPTQALGRAKHNTINQPPKLLSKCVVATMASSPTASTKTSRLARSAATHTNRGSYARSVSSFTHAWRHREAECPSDGLQVQFVNVVDVLQRVGRVRQQVRPVRLFEHGGKNTTKGDADGGENRRRGAAVSSRCC